MFESREHHELVLKGKEYISRSFPELSYLYHDDYSPLGAAFVLDGLVHQPDIIGFGENLFIIGEAKTEKDTLTKHSKKQYDEYLLRCNADPRLSYLFVFVTWKMKAAMSDLLRIRSRQLCADSVNWHVISEVELNLRGI